MSNVHKYWVMNDGEVKHEDYVNDGIDQYNDFTCLIRVIPLIQISYLMILKMVMMKI